MAKDYSSEDALSDLKALKMARSHMFESKIFKRLEDFILSKCASVGDCKCNNINPTSEGYSYDDRKRVEREEGCPEGCEECER